NGVATFLDLSLNKTGTGYWLTATATGLNATSSGFTITPGAATQLVFGTQPGTTVAGQQITPAVKLRALDAPGNVATRFSGAISPAVQLSALDPAGNLVPTFTGSVTVALGNNPGGSTLGGTTTVAAVGGVVTFSDLTLDKTAPGYWLTATGLGTATSSSFNIIDRKAGQEGIGAQPGRTSAGQQSTRAAKLRALDT